MIRLEVEEYCHECKAFSPVSDTNTGTILDPKTFTDTYVVETVITCSSINKCRAIARYLERKKSAGLLQPLRDRQDELMRTLKEKTNGETV